MSMLYIVTPTRVKEFFIRNRNMDNLNYHLSVSRVKKAKEVLQNIKVMGNSVMEAIDKVMEDIDSQSLDNLKKSAETLNTSVSHCSTSTQLTYFSEIFTIEGTACLAANFQFLSLHVSDQ